LTLVTRNFHSSRGEIDLIMLDRQLLVFIEVRFRGHGSFTNPVESITRRKRDRITATARYFLHTHREHARRRCRFDVVSVTRRNYAPSCTDSIQFEWIRDAFDASEGSWA
jgi:putative endonuclease